jgi:hypothetical protein
MSESNTTNKQKSKSEKNTDAKVVGKTQKFFVCLILMGQI